MKKKINKMTKDNELNELHKQIIVDFIGLKWIR